MHGRWLFSVFDQHWVVFRVLQLVFENPEVEKDPCGYFQQQHKQNANPTLVATSWKSIISTQASESAGDY